MQQPMIAPMEPTSLSLLDRLRRQPTHDDWTRLVALYQPFVERFIRLDATMADDAADICQNVLRKLVENIPDFRRERDGSFRAWLRTITVNEVNYYWRRRYRDADLGFGDHSALAEALQDPRSELSRQWDREHASHVLQRLQELVAPEFSLNSWRAFRMRVFEEKSTAEVAEALGISKNAVDIAKSRVLARLRDEAAGLIGD